MDYRSYVSSAKNTAFKLILFLLFFSLVFFSFVFSVCAADITVGSNDIVFSYVDRANFNFFKSPYKDFMAYRLEGSNYGGRTFIVDSSQVTNNTVYLLNPDSVSFYYAIYGGDTSTLLSNVNRPSSGTGYTSNTISNITFLKSVTTASSVNNLSIDLSSYLNDYDYIYISVSITGQMYSSLDFTLFTRGAVVTTPSPTASPTSIPSSSPTVLPSSVPSASDTLDDFTFWATCYDQVWKNGNKTQKPIKQVYVPTFVGDLSSPTNGIYSYVYSYPVRIPFRVEASKFHGEGFFDASFSGNISHLIEGLDDITITHLIEFSTPWVESVDSISFNALFDNGNFGFDVINVPLHNGTSAEFFYCFDVYLTFSSNHQWSNFADRLILNLYNIDFSVLSTSKVSDLSSDQILNNINNNIIAGNEQDKSFHDQEQEEAEKAIDQLNSGLDQVTGTLTSWEIVTMPVTVVQDLVDVLKSDGSTGLTFPSFSLMGYVLWPSYTFDLNIIKEKFPVLYNALHLITGIMVVSWFLKYLWRKWHLLVGDDMPED